MTASVTWYFSTIAQRMSLYSWKVLLQRGVLEVTGLGGIVLFLAGLNDLKKVKHHVMILLWLIAVAVYVLFFNLNLVHNYYQLPLLAPASVVMGLGLEYIHKNFHVSLIFPIVLMLSINLVYSEQSYYTIRNDEIEMAQIIRSHTRLNSKVIVTNEKWIVEIQDYFTVQNERDGLLRIGLKFNRPGSIGKRTKEPTIGYMSDQIFLT